MTVMVSLQEIYKEFGEKTILNKVSFHIGIGDRIGLVGINGAGKSTLANIIYGNLKPESGNILWCKKEIEIGYLKQGSHYCQRSFSGREIEIKDDMSAKNTLKAKSYLGLDGIDAFEKERLNSLSGGEKMKLALASMWAKNPDFLILDEPTNHIDHQGVQWLIDELKRYKGTILIISHDRYFLDKAVNKIVELNRGTAEIYHGNYSFYKEEKRRRYEAQLHQYQVQESDKARIQHEINTLKQWSDKAHRDSMKKQAEGLGKKEYFRVKAKKRDRQIKSKIKRLEKIEVEGVKRPEEDKKIDFKFNDANLKSTRIIEASSIKKSFESRILFRETSFFIMRGERVGIFGANGCGKTTLLRILLGHEKLDEGELFISKALSIGYLSQEALDVDYEKTVLEAFDISSRVEESSLRTLLANMGFNEKMIKQPLSTLSLGEITRIRMTNLIFKKHDMLVLDEPLNHLDIYSREKLEEALKEYEGTIILVSHDRYMIERICDCLLVFEKCKIKKIVGEPKDYLDSLYARGKNDNHTMIQNEKSIKEQKMLIENEIAYVLGELSYAAQGSERYKEMDSRFKELISKKRELQRI